MLYHRSLRKKGQLLELDGICYRIEGTEGVGGSSVVYLASYEDKLNQEERHYVLIKELFPYHSRGDIYRAMDGSICVKPGAEQLMEYHRHRFRQGNQANLTLMKKTPAHISGNLNSYEAYGTYYSVLFVHGGKTLLSILEERSIPWELSEMADVLQKICKALEGFHDNGFLHLDISPDNLLLLPTYVLLIDYNSVWELNAEETDFVFSEKQGYSAPEIRMRNEKKIGVSSDIYSICAVFFRMLAGRTLSEAELMGNGLKQTLKNGFPVLKKESPTVTYKVLQILTKGLHLLPARRYQSVAEFLADLLELSDRIEKKGLSHAALWESSCYALKRKNVSLGHILPQKILLDGVEEQKLSDKLKDKSLLLLKGVGGMGKTTLLQVLWKKNLEKYHPGLPVVYYISLKDYQMLSGREDYIHQELLKYFTHTESQSTYQDACHEMKKYLETCENTRLVLLLDGLNEAGEQREKLLQEIELLGNIPGISILVTDRTDDVKKYALKEFDVAELLPLEEPIVCEELRNAGGNIPENERLLQLLKNPMMLKMYLNIQLLQKENNDRMDYEADIRDVDVLVTKYLEQLLQKQLRIDSGNESMQLCHSYILQHFLPAVAGRMVKRKRTVLSLEELYELAEISYDNLYHKGFGKCFPEYMGKSRLMLSEIADVSEWFDFAVSEQLVKNLGLLTTSENQHYQLMHDHFISALAQMDEENRKAFRSPKVLKYRMMLALGVLGILAAGSVMLIQARRLSVLEENSTDIFYTEEEQKVIDRVIACIQWNVNVISQQIMVQREVLEEAQTESVLQNDSEAVLELQELIRHKQKSVKTLTTSELKETLLEELLQINEDLPVEHLISLCARPQELKSQLDSMLLELENILCTSGLEGSSYFYTEAEERKKVIEAYRQYLDAYTNVVFYEFSSLICYLDKEQAAEVFADTCYSKIFRDYLTNIKWEEINPKMIDAAIGQAEELLKETKANLKTTGFQWRESK